jgi:hypothetical protein
VDDDDGGARRQEEAGAQQTTHRSKNHAAQMPSFGGGGRRSAIGDRRSPLPHVIPRPPHTRAPGTRPLRWRAARPPASTRVQPSRSCLWWRQTMCCGGAVLWCDARGRRGAAAAATGGRRGEGRVSDGRALTTADALNTIFIPLSVGAYLNDAAIRAGGVGVVSGSVSVLRNRCLLCARLFWSARRWGGVEREKVGEI